MRKHLKSLLVFALVVPCLVIFSACGAPTKMADGDYVLDSLSAKMPGVSVSINFAELFDYIGDDFDLEEILGGMFEDEEGEESGEGDESTNIIGVILQVLSGDVALFSVNGNKLTSPIFESTEIEYTLTSKGIIKVGDEELSYTDEETGMVSSFKYTKNKITLSAEIGEDIDINLVLKKAA